MMTAAVYDLILILPVMLAVFELSAAELLLVPADLPLPLFLIPLICCVVLILYKHLKSKGRILISGILLAFVIAVLLGLPAGERIEILSEHLWVLKSLLLMTAVFFAADILNRFISIRFIGSMAALLSLPIMLFIKYEPGNITVCMILLYAILNLIEAQQLKSKKKGDTDHVKHLVFISPFVIIFFVIFLFIKVPDKPYDWKIVKRIGGAITELCLDISDKLFNPNALETEEAFIGFSGKGGFPGKIRGNDGVALNVSTMTENDDKLYLAGRIFSNFTGREWEEGAEPDETESCLDTLTSICAMNRVEDVEMKYLIKKTTLNITYKGLRGRNLFLPPKNLYVKAGEDKDADDYKTVFYRINRREEAFERLMKEGCDIDRKEWDDIVKLYISGNTQGLSYEDYLAYKENINTLYLPETIVSDELRNYLDELTKDAESDYEKLMLIEETLREGTYTATPGALPEEIQSAADYLDHFVLEKKEGYCSHYATAFVLLSRACGIPARFVQGFRVKAGREKSIDVRSDKAHAWGEAYIEGYGWLIFEPTPGYISEPGWDRPDIVKDERQISMNSASANIPQIQDQGEGSTEEEEEEKSVFKWYMIFIPVASGLGLAAVLLCLDAVFKKSRYKKMSAKEKCAFRCRNCMEILKRYGYKREKEETLEEYRLRISEDIPEEKLLFIGLYEYIIYGDGDVDPSEADKAEGYAADLKKTLRAKRFGRNTDED